MKLQTALLVVTGMLAGSALSNAAGIMVNNILGGPGVDTLYAKYSGALMDGGLVTMGYFPETINTSDIDTTDKLLAQLSKFTLITSAVPGSENVTIGGKLPGYVDQADFTSIGNITIGNQLLGRMLYSIVTSASSLATANSSSEFALLAIGTIKDDVPVENQYTSNPAGLVPVIGMIDSFNGDAGGGEGVYTTLKMVPEASTALLGALGALGLLRRRR